MVQFHTQTRTGKVEMLNRLSPERCYIEIHPNDAVDWGIVKGDEVEVISRRGKVGAVAEISDTLQRGEIFMPMHYEETNRLTFPAFDPYSAEPAYKHAAVKVRKVAAGHPPS